MRDEMMALCVIDQGRLYWIDAVGLAISRRAKFVYKQTSCKITSQPRPGSRRNG